MTGHTVVGLFDSYAQAESAVTRLVGAGIGREHVEIADNDATAAGSTAARTTTRTTTRDDDRSIGDRISDFFSRLFGDDDDDDDARTYAEAIRRGGAVVTVHAPTEAEADRAADILESCGAVDVDERSSQWRDSGWTGASAAARTAERQDIDRTDPRVIPVVDEELKIGKRRRDRGGVRIYTHLAEQPVEEQVRLREEHAHVERRPADRPATEADLAAFKTGTIEVRESVEEPVVAKTARVVEEVVIAKETTERVETVNDVVRRGEVDVERVDATRARDATTVAGQSSRHDEYDTDYRTHWQSNYGAAGGSYEDYRPAYEYGSRLASDDRFRGRDWSEVERDARTDWERRYPNRPWERMKAAVAHGRDRVSTRR